jgi:hypothetical protein
MLKKNSQIRSHIISTNLRGPVVVIRSASQQQRTTTSMFIRRAEKKEKQHMAHTELMTDYALLLRG